MLAGAVALGWWRGLPWPLLAASPEWLVIGAGSGLALGALSLQGARAFPALARLAGEFRKVLGPMGVGQALILAGASGLAEEALFRGVLLPWWGLLASTLVFGLMHFPFRPGAWIWTVFALGAGAWLGWMTLASGSLGPAVLCHVAVNAVSLSWIGRLPIPEE